MNIDSTLQWTDKIVISSAVDGIGLQRQEEAVTLGALRNVLYSDPLGITERRYNRILSFGTDIALYYNVINVRAGSVIKYVGLQVLQDITAGGTSLNIGLGQHDSTPSAYGYCNLSRGSSISTLVTPNVLTQSTAIDLCAVTSDGSALGDTQMSNLLIFLNIVLDVPTGWNTDHVLIPGTN